MLSFLKQLLPGAQNKGAGASTTAGKAVSHGGEMVEGRIDIPASADHVVIPASRLGFGGDFVWRDNARDLYKEITDAIRKGEGSILNKHLYIGIHGAAAWEKVEDDPSFEIRRLASDLLRRNLREILDVIREDSGNGPLDVVSLGSGTGKDDLVILDEVWRCFPEYMTLFTVDLSTDLLRRAVKNVVAHLDNRPAQRKKTSLHAICVDIDQLHLEQKYFVDKACQTKRVFHLLGLTLGNNSESRFLYSISRGMTDGDYLLLGVDFCLEKEEWLKESVGSYRNTAHAIMNFLSGPLVTALQVHKDKSYAGTLHFFGQMPKLSTAEEQDYYDYVQNGINVMAQEVVEAKQEGLSDVNGALSIARYYVEVGISRDAFTPAMAKAGGPAKLFDFSNKYTPSDFVAFLQNNMAATRLKLVEADVLRWGRGSQHLLLLKKDSNDTGILAHTAVRSLAKMIRVKLATIERSYRETNVPFKDLASRARQLIPMFENTAPNLQRLASNIKRKGFQLEVFTDDKPERVLEEAEKLTS